MKRIDLGQTIQILANVGVIAGIVFLGLEMRQNTRSLEISAYQQLVSQVSQLAELRLTHPNVGQVDASSLELEGDERITALNYFIMVLLHGDMAFYQYERGVISRDRLEKAMSPLKASVCLPFNRAQWSERLNDVFVSSYRNYVDAVIEDC